MNNDKKKEELLKKLENKEFDFIDFGAGTGASINWCKDAFGLSKGLGIDKSNKKIENSNVKDMILADIFSLEIPEKCVKFSSMIHFLEHLSNFHKVEKMIKRASLASCDFLFIQHPNFEDIDYLSRLNLKLSWTDWSGHPNMLHLKDFRYIFKKLNLNNYTVIPREQIFDSSYKSIIPINAPCDTVFYDANLMEKKKYIIFNKPIWKHFDIFVSLDKNITKEKWDRIINASKLSPTYKAQQKESFLKKTLSKLKS